MRCQAVGSPVGLFEILDTGAIQFRLALNALHRIFLGSDFGFFRPAVCVGTGFLGWSGRNNFIVGSNKVVPHRVKFASKVSFTRKMRRAILQVIMDVVIIH